MSRRPPKYFSQNSRLVKSSQKLQIDVTRNIESLKLDEDLPVLGKNSPSNSRSIKPKTSRALNSPKTQTPNYSLKPYFKSESAKTMPKTNSFITKVKNPFESKPVPAETKSRSEVLYKEHLFQTFQAIKFVRTMPSVDLNQLRQKRVNVPKRPGYENKKTIVFDLDETLVHCVESVQNSPDVVLPITFPTGEVIEAGINIRPFAKQCLEEASKHFEVFVFTASHRCYADVVLDHLDPEKELIHQRFYRDNCLVVEGVFIKDLRIFANRRMQDIVIVDNAAYSFGYQLDNGIPIISWHDDPYDKELYNLMDYIKLLAQAHDVREVNQQTFHLRTFYEDYTKEFMQGSLTSPRTRRSPRQSTSKFSNKLV